MVAQADTQTERYWFEGLPADGLVRLNQGTETYWFEGLPGNWLFPAGGVRPARGTTASKLLAAGMI